MFRHKFTLVMVLILSFTLIAGCSGSSSALLDDNGDKVSLEKQDQPSLVFFFTGVG